MTDDKTKPDEAWGHAATPDPDAWTGCFATRAEAIADGRAWYGGEPFYVQRGVKLLSLDLLPAAEDVVQMMASAAYDEVGEAADEWPDVSPDAEAELTALLRAWAIKHVDCELWRHDGTDGERIDAAPTPPATGGDQRE